MPFGMSVMYKVDPAPAADGARQDYFKITMEDVLVSSWQTSASDGGVHESGHWMDTNTPSAAGANTNIANHPHQLSLRSSSSHAAERESTLIYSGESGGLNEAHSADTQVNPPWGLDRIDLFV